MLDFARAALIAALIWGAHPSGCATVNQHPFPLPRSVLGEAYGCIILYNSRRSWYWGKFCTTAIHEWGHLAGRGHSSNPRSVMYYRFTHVDRRCEGA